MQNGDQEAVVIPGPPATHEDITEELIHVSRQTGSRMKKAIILSGILSLFGFIGIAMQMANGIDDHTKWNFYAVIYFYIFSVTMGIPMAGIGLRFARAQWRRPTSRSAELFAIAGPVNLIFFIPILMVAPPIEGRNSVCYDSFSSIIRFCYDTRSRLERPYFPSFSCNNRFANGRCFINSYYVST